MAGILWRLNSAAVAGELKGIDEPSRSRLHRVVTAIWKPFDGSPKKQPVDLDPHYYGAFYTQALVAWLCAWRAGMATEEPIEVVQRAGRAVVRWKSTTSRNKHDVQRVCERMHLEYLALSHEPVWGSREKDIVWKAFFA